MMMGSTGVADFDWLVMGRVASGGLHGRHRSARLAMSAAAL
jgi:hypothetical protein